MVLFIALWIHDSLSPRWYAEIITEEHDRAQSLLRDRRAPLEIATQHLQNTETIRGTSVKQALDACSKYQKG